MTYSQDVKESGVQGDLHYMYADVDITSLSATGVEPYDPEVVFGELTDVHGVAVVGTENSDTYGVVWDHLSKELVVTTLSDGSAASSGTDVGVVRIKVEGE